MPREKIQDESGIQAQVVWSHDQYVQVATVSTKPAEFVEWCRMVVRNYETGGADALNHEHLGMFWTPSRAQINEMIRVLRRARDQAHGRDE